MGHFRWVGGWVWGGLKKKLLRICWNMLSFWNFQNLTKCFPGRGRSQKKSCSEFAETCCRFGIFEIWQNIFPVGGSQKQVAQNLLKHALILEFSKSDKFYFQGGGGGGGGSKEKLFRMCWNMLSFWNFWNQRKKKNFMKKFTDRHHSDQIRGSAWEAVMSKT